MEILLKIEDDSKLSKFFRYLSQEQREQVIKRLLRESFNSKLDLKKSSDLSILGELKDKLIAKQENIVVMSDEVLENTEEELKTGNIIPVDSNGNSSIKSILLDTTDDDDDMLFDLVK